MKKDVFRFAVVGDPHYVREDAHRLTFEGRKGYRGEIEDLRRYLWAGENIYPKMFATIRDQDRLDAVFLLGDIVQGNCDDLEATEREFDGAGELLASLKCPIFAARGNHDHPKVFEKRFPSPGEALGKNSYRLRRPGVSFFVLDSAETAEESCQRRFAAALAATPPDERVFVFSHEPIALVSRPFFADRRFIAAARDIARSRAVDCWFAGHTHEQIFSLVRNGDRDIFQAATSAMGDDEKPLPLEFARDILLGEGDSYFYGFHENTCPSWLIAEVGPDGARLSHRTLMGEMAGFEWDRAGDVSFRPTPLLTETRKRQTIAPEALKSAVHAEARFALYNALSDKKRAFLNGVDIGALPIGGAYAGHPRLAFSPSLLKPQNVLRIVNPENEAYTIGGVFIQLTLADGRQVCSSRSRKIYAYTDKWSDWDVDIVEQKQPGDDVVVQLDFQT